jgi:hypothetical protein
MYENDFQSRMAAGKDRAQRNRDAGGSSVTVYPTTNAMLHRLGRLEADNFDRWLAEVRDRVAEICEHSRFTIYGETWRDFR